MLRLWRPKTGGCRILITSRRSHWNKALGVNRLPLAVFQAEESVALLRKHRPDLTSAEAGLHSIADELGHLPLALHLAGNFLSDYQNVIDPTTYLKQLRSPDLLQHQSLTRRDQLPTEYEQDVARAFALSYERLDEGNVVDRQARDLLARAAYLVPGELIPRDVMTALAGPLDDAASYQFEDALKRLVDTGLLEEVAGGMFRVHRLVVAFVRTVTNDIAVHQAVEDGLLSLATRRKEAGFPAPVIVLLPHLKEITDKALEREDAQAGSLCNTLAESLSLTGDYARAYVYATHALTIRERVLGEEHPDTLYALNSLASVLRSLGDYNAARPLFERALAIWEQVLGPDHQHTAATLNNLGMLLQNLGEYAAARPLFERALAIWEQVLGPDHRYTATALNNLGLLLYNVRDYTRAKPLLERALDIHDRVFGLFHPDSFNVLCNLAQIHTFHGNRIQARMYLTRALDTFERNPSLKNVSEQQLRRQLAQLGGPFRNVAKPKQKPKRKK